jgi:hypothetical protein
MDEPRVVGIRVESPEEKRLREFFDEQEIKSLANLEDAARLLIGLVTGLLGALFAVLTVASNPLPAYLKLPLVRALGVGSIVFLLMGFGAAIIVVLPREWRMKSALPADEAKTFQAMLAHKSAWLSQAVVWFGAGVALLGAVLVVVLLTIQ